MPGVSARGTYLIIAEALRNEIQADPESSILPSEAKLMEFHGVSRNTIRRALKTLEAEEVSSLLRGSGGAWSRKVTGGRSRNA